jgi:hypothetical protein
MTPHETAATIAARYKQDPLGFVRFAFPWGKEGTELAKTDGPRQWQIDVLDDLGRRLRAGQTDGLHPVLKALCSGHGTGKSALIAQLIVWAMATCVDAKVLVTSGTEQQLRSKLWPEVAKWFRLSVFRNYFRQYGTSILAADSSHEKTWRCDAVTWSETNTEAFQGLHNQGRRIVLIFDEASGIADRIWQVAEGALTDEDTEILWIVSSNPTKPDGAFFRCFHEQRHRWAGVQIDSRTVPGTNHKLFDEWRDLYGEDSDFFRVRVRGQFPRAGALGFIQPMLVEQAMARPEFFDVTEPVIMGCDIARFGDDQSVIAFRRGRDAKSIPWIKLRGSDTMQTAATVVEWARMTQAAMVFIDGGGVGGGVIDRVRQLGLKNVVEVSFGAKADRQSGDQGTRFHYANKRAEMWGWMREWLMGGAIPNDPELRADLTGPTYNFVVRDGRDAIQLERKADMKLRGLASPDAGDALACTFAYPVIPQANPDAIKVPAWVPEPYRQHEHAYRWGLRQQAASSPYDATGGQRYDPMGGIYERAHRAVGSPQQGTWKGIGRRDR